MSNATVADAVPAASVPGARCLRSARQCGHAASRQRHATYVTYGMYYSTALDSELYRCQWHRVILRGDIPTGARVVVSTYTAEALLTDEQVQNLGDAWETNQTAE